MKRNIGLTGLENRIGDGKTVTNEVLYRTLDQLRRRYLQAREPLATYWRDYYTTYLTTEEAKRSNVTAASRKVGDVNVNWRHRIKSPKAYETIETLVSYFTLSFFPNDRYFDLVPAEPIASEQANVLIELNRAFVQDKLKESKFKSKYEIFLREMCIAGTAAIMFPWHQDNVSWQVLSPFEFCLDPKSQDPNEANFIRSYELDYVEVIQYVRDGLFNLATEKDIRDIPQNRHRDLIMDEFVLDTIQNMMGLSYDEETPDVHRYTIYEFWGDLHLEDVILKNVRISWCDNLVLNLDDNPYGFRPFLVGTYLRLSQSPYGIGALQPIESQLYYKDTLTSRQADNVAVSADTMFEVVVDGVLNVDDVFVAPGKKIPVTKANSLNPIVMPNQVNTSMQELALIDQTADKAIGTGPYVGVNAGRTGERVTAQEVIAQRDTGGKRLSNVFSGIETEVFLPALERFHYYSRRFYNDSHMINYLGIYIRITPQTIDFPMKVKSLGASNVADREYSIRQLLDFLSVVAQNQQMAETVNWAEVTKELAYQMVPQCADKFLQQEAPPPQAEQMPMGIEQQAMGDMNDAAGFVGGNAAQQAMQAQLMAGQNPAENVQALGGQPNDY